MTCHSESPLGGVRNPCMYVAIGILIIRRNALNKTKCSWCPKYQRKLLIGDFYNVG